MKPTRTMGAAVAIGGGAIFFLLFVSGFYPVHHWLFWRYAGYLLGASAWALACLSLGYEVTARLCPWLGKTEQLVVGLANGVLAFALAIFCLGVCHALHWTVSLALPLAFLATGQRRLRRDLPRLARRFNKALPARTLMLSLPIWGLCLLGVTLIYLALMTPQAFTFDARWYHMPIAQRYALSGAVVRFDEGFWPGAFPQLLSYLYTWVYLLPGLIMFDRMELGVHLEFVLFLATLVQIPVAVRRLAPGAPRWFSWCVRLAFPGLYLYDGNLNAGADHVAGFFALPLLIAVLTAWRGFHWRRVALVGVLLAAIGLTKYTAYALAGSAGLIVMGRGVYLGTLGAGARGVVAAEGPRLRRAAWSSLTALIGVVLLFTAPHWLKNWIWYGDPIYPQLASYLQVRPWGPEFALRRAELATIQQGADLSLSSALNALRTTVTFSFLPNNFPFLHRDVPVFGSLFTLSLPALFFLKRPGRLWGVALGTMLAVVLWFMLAHYDRYLQTLAPVMAATAAAVLGRVWELGSAARFAVVGLVGVQVIWGTDVPFFRTHNQINESPLRHTAQFLASGFEKTPNRLEVFPPLPAVGRAIPEDAVLLMHDTLLVLGTERNWVTDLAQSSISYAHLRTPAAIHGHLKKLGVTHLAWHKESLGADSLAGDLAFADYATKYITHQKVVGDYHVGELPKASPPAVREDLVVGLYSCGPLQGLVPFETMMRSTSAPQPPPKPITSAQTLAQSADFVVVDRNCHPKQSVPRLFQRAVTRGPIESYVRRTNRR